MSNNDTYYGSSAFVDDADEDVEYTYNANGSMTKDLNKGITNIEYDNAGNLKKVTFNDNRSISYVYAADGTRLRTVHSHKRGTVTINDSIEYFGNLVLRNGNPDQYMFNDGYYSYTTNSLPTGEGWGETLYYIKDYLGSNRMVMNKTGSKGTAN